MRSRANQNDKRLIEISSCNCGFTAEEIEQYSIGSLVDADRIDAIELNLLTCARCQQILEEEDRFLQSLALATQLSEEHRKSKYLSLSGKSLGLTAALAIGAC
jgi:arginine decarboxylase-like protein